MTETVLQLHIEALPVLARTNQPFAANGGGDHHVINWPMNIVINWPLNMGDPTDLHPQNRRQRPVLEARRKRTPSQRTRAWGCLKSAAQS
jgi:hypothetical protein